MLVLFLKPFIFISFTNSRLVKGSLFVQSLVLKQHIKKKRRLQSAALDLDF